jgi:hypothetical protein
VAADARGGFEEMDLVGGAFEGPEGAEAGNTAADNGNPFALHHEVMLEKGRPSGE